jgi:hypothetical protein
MSIEIKIEDIPWLDQIPSENRYNELLKIIRLGRSIIEFTQISINPECSVLNPFCHKFEMLEKDTRNARTLEEGRMEKTRELINSEITTATTKINDVYQKLKQEQNSHECNLQEIKNSINIFTGSVNKSSVKGNVSETIIENIISNFFTEDTLINTSKEAKCCDYKLSTKESDILIEVKNYKTAVDQKEVDKFIRDVKHNKTHGIFISTTSKIVKKKLLEIEELPSGEITVYISDTGISGEKVIFGILLIKELILSKNNKKVSINSIDSGLILENIEKFNEISTIVCNMTNSIGIIKENINKSMQDLYNESYRCDIQIKSLFKSIQYEIQNELSKIDSTIQIVEIDERSKILEDLKISNSKIIQFVEMIFTIEDNTKCKLSIVDNKWKFINNTDEIICDIKKYKTKIELKFVHVKTLGIQIELNLNSTKLIESEIFKSI